MKKYLIIAAVASTALYLLLATAFDSIRSMSLESARAAEAQVEAIQ